MKRSRKNQKPPGSIRMSFKAEWFFKMPTCNKERFFYSFLWLLTSFTKIFKSVLIECSDLHPTQRFCIYYTTLSSWISLGNIVAAYSDDKYKILKVLNLKKNTIGTKETEKQEINRLEKNLLDFVLWCNKLIERLFPNLCLTSQRTLT